MFTILIGNKSVKSIMSKTFDEFDPTLNKIFLETNIDTENEKKKRAAAHAVKESRGTRATFFFA
jgi:hypothetical protein